MLGTHTSCSRHGECNQEYCHAIILASKSTLLMSKYFLISGKVKIFFDISKTKVLIPAVLRSEWMFSCSCERCSDPAQADMGTHMSSFSCGCGGFYTTRQTCRRCATKFGTENTILREDIVLKVMASSNICS